MPDVIIISTDHDPVTKVLTSYADLLSVEAGARVSVRLHMEAAASIQKALSKNGAKGVFCFMHGSDTPPSVVDHTGAAVIDQATAGLLGNRIFCGTCHSLNGFGDHVVNHGGAVIGYAGDMMVPFHPKYAAEMGQAALAPHRSLLAGYGIREATATAEGLYRDVARGWFKLKTLRSQLLAAMAEANADAVGVKGDNHAAL